MDRILSGGLFTLQSRNGSIGAWAEPQNITALDPTETYNLADLIDAYNTVVWGLCKSGALMTEQLVGFNEISYGVDIQINGGAALEYRYGSSTCKITTVLSDLNTLLVESGVTFTFLRQKQVIMNIPDGVTVSFNDPPGLIRGTGIRFLQKLLGPTLPASVVGPITIQGPELNTPFIGVYPAPAGISNLRASDTKPTSITLSWEPSPTPDVSYLVFCQDLSQTFYTTDALWTFTGLTADTPYSFRVRTLTENAISADFTSIVVRTTVVQPNTFGPIPAGKTAATSTPYKIYGNIVSGNNTIGFIVPPGSPYINYTFHKILLPGINKSYVGMVASVSEEIDQINYGDIEAHIYRGKPILTNLPIATAPINITSDPLAYIFEFSSPITMEANMHIAFVCKNTSITLQYYYYFPQDNTISPIVGKITSTLFDFPIVNTQTPGVLCTFIKD